MGGNHPVEHTIQRIMYRRETLLVAKQSGWTGLGDHDPTRIQPGLDDLVILFRVKFVGRPAFQWVDQIHDHYVEAFLSVLQERPGVLVPEIKPRVVKTALMVLRQKAPAKLHNLLIQVQHNHPLDRTVGQGFPQRAPLASAPDENRARPRVETHGGVDQSFVVNEFVSFGRLSFSIQYQATAEGLGFKHFDLLVGGMSRMKNFPHLKHHCQVRENCLQIPFSG